jgi:hypothetical protein
MKRRTLEGWLVRAVQGADRLELRHKGTDDDEFRVLRSYSLASLDGPRMSEIAGEVLADAQGETDLAEARCSFVIAALSSDRIEASIRLRCDPVRDDGTVDQHAQEEPSREGVTAMVMRQNRELHNLVLRLTEPKRQNEGVSFVVELLTHELEAQRNENSKLRAIAAAKSGDDEAELTAEILEEQRQQSEMTQLLLQNGIGLVKQMIADRSRPAAEAPNGHGHDPTKEPLQ